MHLYSKGVKKTWPVPSRIALQTTTLDSPPILGRNRNSYYCSFMDDSNNDCNIIIDPLLKDYILIYKNIVLESNIEELTGEFKEIIKSKLNPPDAGGSDYKIKSTLDSITVFKGKSSIDMFKNNEVGVMQITRNFIYKDEKIGKVVGPSEAHVVIIFDTETKGYFEYDEGNKPKIPKQ